MIAKMINSHANSYESVYRQSIVFKQARSTAAGDTVPDASLGGNTFKSLLPHILSSWLGEAGTLSTITPTL